MRKRKVALPLNLYNPTMGRLIGSFFTIFFMFIAVLRSGRCFKGFLEGVASFSPSMSLWGAMATRFGYRDIGFGT